MTPGCQSSGRWEKRGRNQTTGRLPFQIGALTTHPLPPLGLCVADRLAALIPAGSDGKTIRQGALSALLRRPKPDLQRQVCANTGGMSGRRRGKGAEWIPGHPAIRHLLGVSNVRRLTSRNLPARNMLIVLPAPTVHQSLPREITIRFFGRELWCREPGVSSNSLFHQHCASSHRQSSARSTPPSSSDASDRSGIQAFQTPRAPLDTVRTRIEGDAISSMHTTEPGGGDPALLHRRTARAASSTALRRRSLRRALRALTPGVASRFISIALRLSDFASVKVVI